MKKNSTKEKVRLALQIFVVIVVSLLVLAALISTFLPRLYELYGDGAMLQIFEFLGLLTMVVGMIFLARWQMNEVDKGHGGDNSGGDEKSFFQRIVAKESILFNNTLKTAFHLLPLYFPLLIGKLDLLSEFKVVLFAFSMFAYLLVELKYVFRKILNGVKFVLGKFEIRNWFLVLLFEGISVIIFFIAAFYVGYRLITFYIRWLS